MARINTIQTGINRERDGFYCERTWRVARGGIECSGEVFHKGNGILPKKDQYGKPYWIECESTNCPRRKIEVTGYCETAKAVVITNEEGRCVIGEGVEFGGVKEEICQRCG